MSAARWEKLGAFYLSPGILTQRSHLVLARDLPLGAARRDQTEAAMIARAVPLDDAYRQFRKSLRPVETIGPECRDLLSSARGPLPSSRGIVAPRTGVLQSSGTA